MSEQFDTKQFMERHESVVQGATDRRERREVPSNFEKHQSEEEVKRADPQRVKRADPQRVRDSSHRLPSQGPMRHEHGRDMVGALDGVLINASWAGQLELTTACGGDFSTVPERDQWWRRVLGRGLDVLVLTLQVPRRRVWLATGRDKTLPPTHARASERSLSCRMAACLAQ